MNRIYKILFFIVLLFSFENIMAQTLPNGILFQAVARDASGNAAASRTICHADCLEILEPREFKKSAEVVFAFFAAKSGLTLTR